MSTAANRFVGTWEGEHRAGYAKITVTLQADGDTLSGEWVSAPGSKSPKPFDPIRTPIVNATVEDHRLSFTLPHGQAKLAVRLTNDTEAIFEPLTDLEQLAARLDPNEVDLSDPAVLAKLEEDLQKGIEGHRVILSKIH